MWLPGKGPGPNATPAQLFDNTAFAGKWSTMRQATRDDTLNSPLTGVDTEVLKAVGKASVTVPKSIKVHSRLERAHIEDRLAQLESVLPP